MNTDYGKQIWDYFMNTLNNEFGVAGLMGNLQAESDLLPYRKQGDFSAGYTISLTYTEQVDSGVISESTFVNDSIGYGLAQWTFYTRKQMLFDMKEQRNVSIGDITLALDFLQYELSIKYQSVLEALKNASTLRGASNTVLHDFESPLIQDEQVEIARYQLAEAIYNKYTGSTPTPQPTATTKHMPLWMMIKRR
jgi:hypothetical protein